MRKEASLFATLRYGGATSVYPSVSSALQAAQTNWGGGPTLSMANTRGSWQRAQGAVGAVASGSRGISKFSVTSPTRVVSNSKVV